LVQSNSTKNDNFSSIIYLFSLYSYANNRERHSFPTRRSSDLGKKWRRRRASCSLQCRRNAKRSVSMLPATKKRCALRFACTEDRSEVHTSELQSRGHLVCRLLLEKKKTDHSSPAG